MQCKKFFVEVNFWNVVLFPLLMSMLGGATQAFRICLWLAVQCSFRIYSKLYFNPSHCYAGVTQSYILVEVNCSFLFLILKHFQLLLTWVASALVEATGDQPPFICIFPFTLYSTCKIWFDSYYLTAGQHHFWNIVNWSRFCLNMSREQMEGST